MESIQSFYNRKLKGYTYDQYIIIFVVLTLFLPSYVSLAAMVAVMIYLIYTRQLAEVIQATPRGKYAILFCFLFLAVSLYHQNLFGAAQCLGLFFVAVFILYYRKHINHRLLTFIIDASCLISICCFIWGLMEYWKIVNRLDYPFSDLIIMDAPQDRINSTFYNANFYAMMIQFMVLMCIYKILHAKTLRRIVFYTVTILCNLFALYLTGCRAGWLSFLVTIPLMFFINKRKKTSIVMCLIILGGVIAVLINPQIFPRADNVLEYFFDRTDIWKTAILGIKENYLFGLGPNGYYLIFDQFHGPLAPHSHSVYLDPLLSFGIVGVMLTGYFSWPVVKEVTHLYLHKIDVELFGLILCFVLTVLIHGIFDYTIFWIQTGTVFLLILNAASLYR